MAFPTEQQLFDIAEPAVADLHLFVEKITIGSEDGQQVVQVYLDKEGGLDSDDSHAATHAISEAFDAAEAAGTVSFPAKGYVLSVGSLGANAPLTKPRHWRNNRGRLVAVRANGLAHGEKQVMRIGALSADESAVNLIAKAGKKLVVYTVKLADVVKAKIEIEFNNPPKGEMELAGNEFTDTTE